MDYCLLCKSLRIRCIWQTNKKDMIGRLLQISNNVLYKRFSFDEVLFYEYIELFKLCIDYNTSLDVPSQVFVQYWFYVKVWDIEVKAIDRSITFLIQYSFYSNMIIRINSFPTNITYWKQQSFPPTYVLFIYWH